MVKLLIVDIDEVRVREAMKTLLASLFAW